MHARSIDGWCLDRFGSRPVRVSTPVGVSIGAVSRPGPGLDGSAVDVARSLEGRGGADGGRPHRWPSAVRSIVSARVEQLGLLVEAGDPRGRLGGWISTSGWAGRCDCARPAGLLARREQRAAAVGQPFAEGEVLVGLEVVVAAAEPGEVLEAGGVSVAISRDEPLGPRRSPTAEASWIGRTDPGTILGTPRGGAVW